jgi:hypothetical protein
MWPRAKPPGAEPFGFVNDPAGTVDDTFKFAELRPYLIYHHQLADNKRRKMRILPPEGASETVKP